MLTTRTGVTAAAAAIALGFVGWRRLGAGAFALGAGAFALGAGDFAFGAGIFVFSAGFFADLVLGLAPAFFVLEALSAVVFDRFALLDFVAIIQLLSRAGHGRDRGAGMQRLWAEHLRSTPEVPIARAPWAGSPGKLGNSPRRCQGKSAQDFFVASTSRFNWLSRCGGW
ncbi:MAG: hypothetical protein ACLQIB_40970 [Isosphaeraceae bacterium]